MVEEINEFAIIFKRVKSEYDLVEEFIPFKVVCGYYYEDDMVFIDTEQNVYSHIASQAEIGNVYGGRRNIFETLKINPKCSLEEFEKYILNQASKYEYYKNANDDSDDYGIVMMKRKKGNKIYTYNDKDSPFYYEMYNGMDSEDEEDNNSELTVASSNGIDKEEHENFKTPDQVIDEVKKTIKGQDEAIIKIVTLIWMKYMYPEIPKSNMLIIGPSGCGKTAIFKKIKELLNVPMTIFGITGTSQSGYKGHDIEEMLATLYYDSDKDLDKAQKGIIFIDEFDKIAANRDTGEIGTIAVQNELLKLIEGCSRTVSLDTHQSVIIDTSDIIFVCCGAFSDLYEKKKQKVVGFDNYEKEIKHEKVTTDRIIDYGIIRELAGRLPVIIELNDLNNNRQVLSDILLNSDESVFSMLVNAIQSEGITIENIDEVTDLIVNDAIERKIGARGLISPIRNMFLKIFYEIANNPQKYERLIIGTNIINDNTDYKLIPKQVKKLVKKKAEAECD